MSCKSVTSSGTNFSYQPIVEKEEDDPLLQIFGSEEQIQMALNLLREDRIFGSRKLNDLLMSLLSSVSNIDAQMIQQDPLNAVLSLMLKGDESENFRLMAAEAYKFRYPQDKRFEAAYFFLKDPQIFIGHLLMIGGKWLCSDRNEHFFMRSKL